VRFMADSDLLDFHLLRVVYYLSDAYVNTSVAAYWYFRFNSYMCKTSPMDFLARLRDQLGLTAFSMAKYLNLSYNTYVHYETKAKGINLSTLVHIRRRLALTWDKLGALIEKEVDLEPDKEIDLDTLRKAQRKKKPK
jgi:hypothetical protein